MAYKAKSENVMIFILFYKRFGAPGSFQVRDDIVDIRAMVFTRANETFPMMAIIRETPLPPYFFFVKPMKI